MEADIISAVVALHVHVAARPDFDVHVAPLKPVRQLDVGPLERYPRLIANWQHPANQPKNQQAHHAAAHGIRQHQPPEAHATGQNGYNFGAGRQLGRHKNHGDENGNRRKKVGEIGKQIDVIAENYFRHSQIMLNKIVVLLREINDANNGHENYYREEKRGQKLLNDVFVENIHD